MAVPDTNTFSLQDVVDEVNPTTNDLVDCIADANSALYDSSYYTPPATSLLEFRNYGASSNVTMTLYLDNFISTASNYLEVYVNGTQYQATNGNSTYYNIIVGAGSSISFSANAEDTTSNNTVYLNIFNSLGLNEYDEGTTPSLSFSYTAPSNNFEIYAETAEI